MCVQGGINTSWNPVSGSFFVGVTTSPLSMVISCLVTGLSCRRCYTTKY
ncbi:uncharacterized protein DEA37_0002724 [Paragonimus westermani]|uniref:Uncharacterized protein n=1 Tax=Paragonimus westermani TaxID=34504 RepID=A0A5J4NB67_9TREM|nr:uncharacterized protein DEA37_0002724 [Paragonimus westermani]